MQPHQRSALYHLWKNFSSKWRLRVTHVNCRIIYFTIPSKESNVITRIELHEVSKGSKMADSKMVIQNSTAIRLHICGCSPLLERKMHPTWSSTRRLLRRSYSHCSVGERNKTEVGRYSTNYDGGSIPSPIPTSPTMYRRTSLRVMIPNNRPFLPPLLSSSW